MLLERRRLDAAEAIRLLTPLQGQDSPAPYVALAARLEGFEVGQLQQALDSTAVVKTTIMRLTLVPLSQELGTAIDLEVTELELPQSINLEAAG